jgi:hypothetical protein
MLSKIIFIVMVTLTFHPKINRVLPIPQKNHVAKESPAKRERVNRYGQTSRSLTINRIFDNRVVSAR